MNIQEINKFLELLRRQPNNMRDRELLLQLIKQHDYKFDKDEILEIYNIIFGRESGLFYTPNKISELISVIAQIYNPKSVIDICCGVGNILSYFKNLETIKGLDINKSSIQLAEYINPNADFSVADAIEYNFGNDKYDLVVVHPPFALMMANRRNAEIEIIRKGLGLLNDNGVAIFIVLEGLLTNSNRESSEFRQQLLLNFSLDMVISLSTAIFHPHTGVKTSILVVRNRKQKQDIFMPNFEDNAVEIADNFKQHKGDFYLPISKITDRLDRRHYEDLEAIEQVLSRHEVVKLENMADIIIGRLDRDSFKTEGSYSVFNRQDKDGKNFVDHIFNDECILKSDDVVICLISFNYQNKIYFYKDDGKKTVINQPYAIIRPKNNDKYITTYLQTEQGLEFFRKQISRFLVGAVQLHLSHSALRNLDIPIIEFSEPEKLFSEQISDSFILSDKRERFLRKNAVYLFVSSEHLAKNEYNLAREYVHLAFELADKEEDKHKDVYFQNINRTENLESEVQQKESLQNRMQKLVEQFTHSLGNVIFPDTIYQVAERLKNLPECRRDTLLLHEAYHAEIIIKLQAELLRHRYGNKEPESFRNMIRKCRRNTNSSDKIKSIEDILNYAVSRATARFLNQHYAGLETIRNKILSQNNTELNQLKQKFEDDILLHNCLSPMEWVSQKLRPIQITQISPLWQKIFILADSYAEALLFGYFSEILFNALKYADHDNKEFLTLSFTETNINDNVYLLSNWSNPTTKQKLPELGTNKGLEAIAEDLKQLNDTEKAEESLLISQQANQFQVTLFFKKDLLIDESNILKIKRPVHLVE